MTIEINCHIQIFDKKYQNFIKNLRHKNRVHAVKLAVQSAVVTTEPRGIEKLQETERTIEAKILRRKSLNFFEI